MRIALDEDQIRKRGAGQPRTTTGARSRIE
jgi:hypothetical protein